MPELYHGHAGELVAPLIMHTLGSYGIEKRLGYVTADNASANDTLCRALEESMSSRHGIDWEGCKTKPIAVSRSHSQHCCTSLPRLSKRRSL